MKTVPFNPADILNTPAEWRAYHAERFAFALEDAAREHPNRDRPISLGDALMKAAEIVRNLGDKA